MALVKTSCGGFIFILIISAIIGAICWPYTINSWLNFVGKPDTIVWWQGSLIGLCPAIGQLSIPLAIFTWIILIFIK